jgi:membrane protease YdiL (CAAX protease family)
MLFLRVVLFAAFQCLIAIAFLAAGKSQPWTEAEGYWAITGLLANVVTFIVLTRLYRREGLRYLDTFTFARHEWWKDLLIAIGLIALAAPISMLPNTFLAQALLGSTEASGELFYRSLPLSVIIIGFIWPLTQGLVELPFYFSFIMPRLERRLKNGWVAWAAASFCLALQHVTLPLIFNVDFMTVASGDVLAVCLLCGVVH